MLSPPATGFPYNRPQKPDNQGGLHLTPSRPNFVLHLLTGLSCHVPGKEGSSYPPSTYLTPAFILNGVSVAIINGTETVVKRIQSFVKLGESQWSFSTTLVMFLLFFLSEITSLKRSHRPFDSEGISAKSVALLPETPRRSVSSITPDPSSPYPCPQSRLLPFRQHT
ncbi:hypothetical protein P691DRAFT_441691 [Macrolepiota fuliginosa MF-IS2]|uniref:Uncharacterized protein n=1 Tax=Macrolepiota fuliginosa MF-IS2 TaxID=1400762 RepID=A0A9P6BWH7_9AGAR|nr:hypothetical protein P691DRAFT_441691 [Macrolepiota fuliginosa MF-IS2]